MIYDIENEQLSQVTFLSFWGIVASVEFSSQIDDAAAPENCTFCCAWADPEALGVEPPRGCLIYWTHDFAPWGDWKLHHGQNGQLVAFCNNPIPLVWKCLEMAEMVPK